MVEQFLFFLIFLILIAAVFRQDFAFTIVYLFAGAYILASWWNRRSMGSLSFVRKFSNRAFLNEEVHVRLEIQNDSLLPVVWLRINESMAVELSAQPAFRRILSLGSHDKVEFEYILQARKRGFYPVGPLVASSGDVLGILNTQISQFAPDYLIVYPKIVPLTRLNLPSRSPLGTLRHTQPVFEDPTRILSKRDYVSGDSLRRIDWKSSAATGRLQVKQYEPSIALETAIFLNLNTKEYILKNRHTATELAIVIAASIAGWVIAQKQSVGLVTNGVDPLEPINGFPDDGDTSFRLPLPIPARKGRSHFTRILELLARVQPADTLPLLDLLQREYVHLPWGTTLVIISETIAENFFDQLFQMRRVGLNILLVVTGQGKQIQELKKQAAYFGFPLFQICDEKDMDIWRR
jgi:uncharacterized protein (DUF58 family)